MKDRVENFFVTLYRGSKSVWKKYHFLVPPRLWKKYIKLLLGIRPMDHFYDPMDKKDYQAWIEEKDAEGIEKKVALKYKPLISVVIPAYNADPKFLRECLDSVLAQSYKNFEICLADDASTLAETKRIREEQKNQNCLSQEKWPYF